MSRISIVALSGSYKMLRKKFASTAYANAM
jgi:hypothetical protein